MARGLAILVLFAAVLGAFVALGPVQVRFSSGPFGVARSTKLDSTASDAQVSSPNAPRDSDPSAPSSDLGSPSVESPRRGAVIAATVPLNTTQAPVAAATPAIALDALPERRVPGFPTVPTETLTTDLLAAAIKQARAYRSLQQPIQARDHLSQIYLGFAHTPEQRARLVEELEPLATEILRSRTVLEDGQLYNVEPGDTLVRLAKPFKVPPEFIARINGIHNARYLRPGQTLKFVNGPFDVLVEINNFELTVLRKGTFVRRFPIGIGRDETPTPIGLNTVLDRQVNPDKWPDEFDRRRIRGGDPSNPLGSRWISLGYGYGIHGTIEPESIGMKASRGCIRMRNEDVEELFDMLTEASRVLIR